MAFTFISPGVSANGSGASTTTPAYDTTGAKLIVVHIGTYATNGTLTDSKGNTWTPLGNRNQGILGTNPFYCINPTTDAAHTFTVNSASTDQVIVVEAFLCDGAVSFDTGAGGGQAGSTTPSYGSVTPAANNSLITSSMCMTEAGVGGSGIPAAIGSGFTLAVAINSGVPGMGGGCGYLMQGTAAAVNPQWTQTQPYISGGENLVFTETATDINVPIPAGALTLATFAPTLGDEIDIAIPKGALTLATFAPTLGDEIDIAIPKGALTLATFAPRVIVTAPHSKGAEAWWWSGPAARMLADAGYLLLVKPPLDERERKRKGGADENS